MSLDTDPHYLRLHPDDNVLTVIVAGGEVPLGHKIAAREISAGEKIIKYGAPIGSAICAITSGAHVHTHNVKSDYLPTFKRGEGPRHAA
ncbi:MAG: UxaA family hydrolase [Chthoniobacteraceae bacterium]